jgi:crossover junction endonuclease MUS81
LGDFQIVYDGEITLIVERKSLSDLQASVKDGRWREQKARCMAHPCAKFVYIIEGSTTGILKDDTPVRKMINSCLINSVLVDSVSFFTTKNVSETAELLIAKIHRIKRSLPRK